MPQFIDVVNAPAENTASEQGQLTHNTLIIMGLTALSRLFGFARDMVLAQIFGATAAFDAFVVAFKIPNFMRRLFGEGAFSQAFIPVLVEYRRHGGVKEVKALINGMSGVLGLVLLLIVLVGEIGAPLLVLTFAPGFTQDSGRYQLAQHLIRITLPYLFVIGLTALAGAILNTYHRFALTAFTPVVLNIILIALAVWWAPHVEPVQAVTVLAWGVALSGVVQLIIQCPPLRNLRLLPNPVCRWRDPGVRRVFKQLLPALLGVSATQVCLLIDNWFASFLPAGSISWLYYSDRLLYFPLGIIGVALATAVMPHLAYQHQGGNRENFAATIDWALRWVFAASIPAALGLSLLAGPILATLMHHGAFTAADVAMTQGSLAAFAVGLPALILIKIFAAAFYAEHDTRTPARLAALAIGLNIAGNFALIFPLAHAGLALSTALASWLNAVLLWFFLYRRRVFQAQAGWLRFGSGVGCGSLLLVLILWKCSGPLSGWLSESIAHNSARLATLIASGISVYVLGLWLAGLRWRHFIWKSQCN
jgi:putative peptidoglycan lipid II flippase